MAKYLVTGGAGFIGSNIVRRLVELGEEVRVLDNISTGKLENLQGVLEQIDLVEGDFTDLAVAGKATEGIDFCLHQGAIPSVPRSIDNPLETNQANVVGTLNMLVACREAGVKRFVYAASSSAYGDSPTMPKVETMPTSPKSPYAIQKLTGEQYTQNFAKIYGLETVCLRYFNVFGPNQDPTSVYSAAIPMFIKKMLAGEEPTIFGDGTTSRDFTYVANNVEANLLACSAPVEAVGEVVNIAGGTEISLTDLVAKINDILGTKIEPMYQPERAGDVKHSLADITKAKNLLQYEPMVSFDEGLKRTVEFYQNL